MWVGGNEPREFGGEGGVLGNLWRMELSRRQTVSPTLRQPAYLAVKLIGLDGLRRENSTLSSYSCVQGVFSTTLELFKLTLN